MNESTAVSRRISLCLHMGMAGMRTVDGAERLRDGTTGGRGEKQNSIQSNTQFNLACKFKSLEFLMWQVHQHTPDYMQAQPHIKRARFVRELFTLHAGTRCDLSVRIHPIQLQMFVFVLFGMTLAYVVAAALASVFLFSFRSRNGIRCVSVRLDLKSKNHLINIMLNTRWYRIGRRVSLTDKCIFTRSRSLRALGGDR